MLTSIVLVELLSLFIWLNIAVSVIAPLRWLFPETLTKLLPGPSVVELSCEIVLSFNAIFHGAHQARTTRVENIGAYVQSARLVVSVDSWMSFGQKRSRKQFSHHFGLSEKGPERVEHFSQWAAGDSRVGRSHQSCRGFIFQLESKSLF